MTKCTYEVTFSALMIEKKNAHNFYLKILLLLVQVSVSVSVDIKFQASVAVEILVLTHLFICLHESREDTGLLITNRNITFQNGCFN